MIKDIDYIVIKVGNGFVVEIIFEIGGILNRVMFEKLGNYCGGELIVIYDL